MALNHEITETAEGLIILRKLLDVPCIAYRAKVIATGHTGIHFLLHWRGC